MQGAQLSSSCLGAACAHWYKHPRPVISRLWQEERAGHLSLHPCALSPGTRGGAPGLCPLVLRNPRTPGAPCPQPPAAPHQNTPVLRTPPPGLPARRVPALPLGCAQSWAPGRRPGACGAGRAARHCSRASRGGRCRVQALGRGGRGRGRGGLWASGRAEAPATSTSATTASTEKGKRTVLHRTIQ